MRTFILITGLLGAIAWVLAKDILSLVISTCFLTIYFYPIIQKAQDKLDRKEGKG